MAIKNIIFDLGGVLLNLDFNKTTEAFSALGVENFNQYFTQFHAHPLFRQLETGAIVNEGFYDELRKTAGIDATNYAIDAAWNAMLLDFPAERIEKIQELASGYRLFLFSNTNAIHHTSFHQSFESKFGFQFDSLFEKAFYSHLAGYRKPDLSAFEYVIREAGVEPAHTLFIDDTLPNIEAAQKAGLKALLVTPEKNMVKLLDEILT